MDALLTEKIKLKMQDQLIGLINERFDGIIDDLEAALLRADGDKVFKFPVGMKSIITPVGDFAFVESSISWSTKTTDETEKEEVSLQPELPLEGKPDPSHITDSKKAKGGTE